MRLNLEDDFLVEERVIVEVKSVDAVAPIHRAQVITYLKLLNCPVGLLLNFNVTSLRKGGIRRLENKRNGEIREIEEEEE